MKAKALWICPRIGKWKTRAVVKASRHEGSFSPEFLARSMFPEPKLSREERFDKSVTEWLLGIPQEPWKPEDDMDD